MLDDLDTQLAARMAEVAAQEVARARAAGWYPAVGTAGPRKAQIAAMKGAPTLRGQRTRDAIRAALSKHWQTRKEIAKTMADAGLPLGDETLCTRLNDFMRAGEVERRRVKANGPAEYRRAR